MGKVVCVPAEDDDDDRFRRIAKSLAGNEKQHRLQALELVELWLTTHASQAEHIELAKLCRALSYAIWLSDEPATTEKITKHVVKLIGIGTSKYFKALLECVGKLWPKLDTYRLDKFYDLITCCLDEIAAIADSHGWNESVKELVHILEEHVTKHWIHASKGLCLHVVDKYYQHILRKALLVSFTTTMEENVNLLWSLFQPVLNDAVQTDNLLASRVGERIFSSFIQECKAAAKEQKYDLVLLVREWLPKLYQFSSSPQRCTKTRKNLYQFYTSLRNIVLDKSLPSKLLKEPPVEEMTTSSPPKRRRSERLKNRLESTRYASKEEEKISRNMEETSSEANPQVVKQVRFSLERNEEYVLPAMKRPRRTRRSILRFQ